MRRTNREKSTTVPKKQRDSTYIRRTNREKSTAIPKSVGTICLNVEDGLRGTNLSIAAAVSKRMKTRKYHIKS